MSAGFDFRKRLGAGYFGEVWRAVNLGLGVECALKCIPPDKVINKNNFYQEAQILKAAEHPNIVSVSETGTLTDGRIYVVMEYLANGSLEDEAKGAYVPLSRAKRLMIDVLRGLEHAHGKKIVHRDIKPANILIGNAGEGKLSDFGLALPDISTLDLTGVKGYQYVIHLAPEVNAFGDHTVLADVYACGVTLYRLVNGDSYLPAVSPSEARRLALLGEYPNRDKYRGFVPLALKKIINRAMSVNPKDRFQSAEEMRRALEKVQAAVDWDEHVVPLGKHWIGSGSNLNIEVDRLEENDGSWSVIVRSGKKGRPLRRIAAKCMCGLDKKRAMREAYRVLQQFVNGKF